MFVANIGVFSLRLSCRKCQQSRLVYSRTGFYNLICCPYVGEDIKEKFCDTPGIISFIIDYDGPNINGFNSTGCNTLGGA